MSFSFNFVKGLRIASVCTWKGFRACAFEKSLVYYVSKEFGVIFGVLFLWNSATHHIEMTVMFRCDTTDLEKKPRGKFQTNRSVGVLSGTNLEGGEGGVG